MSDKYDVAISLLESSGDPSQAIRNAWMTPDSHGAGCLFQFVRPSHAAGPYGTGCLSIIRSLEGKASSIDGRSFDLELTDAIRADERIPDDVDKIEVSDLPVFAEWQRKLDIHYNRE